MPLLNADRLLLALAIDHAYAYRSEDGSVRLVSRRRGVSVESGQATSEAADRLVTLRFAEWQATGARRRLVLTSEGRARAALARGPEALEPARILHGAPERRRDGLREEAESPLAWLARRKGRDGAPLLAPEYVQAGERLRRDLEACRAVPRVTARWDAVVVDGGASPRDLAPSERALAARQRVDAAMAAVGPDLSGLLLDVCGFLKGLETIEAERNWPRRSARVVLEFALARLARHYGLDPRPNRAAPMRSWGADDYRPAIS